MPDFVATGAWMSRYFPYLSMRKPIAVKFKLSIVLALLLNFPEANFAQLTLIKELDFPEKAVLGSDVFERFGYVVDGDWHIVSSIMAGKRQALAYNHATGLVKNTNYIVDDSWDFDGQKIYRGWPTGNQFGVWRYLRLAANGNFFPIDELAAYPSLVAGDYAYGVNSRKVYEMQPFADSTRILFELPPEVNPNALDFELQDETLYVAHYSGILKYDFASDSLSAMHPDYFAANDLEYIPWSGLEGRFLFKKKGPHPRLVLHEAGHGIEPRLIPDGSNATTFNPRIWFQSTPFQLPYVFNQHKIANISSASDLTWFGFVQNAYGTEHGNYLYRIDRSGGEASVNEVVFPNQNLPADIWLKPWVHALDNENVVAMGFYGDEGLEPYGYAEDGLVLLKDFYEGPKGSVDYVNDEMLNGPTRWHRSMRWNGQLLFPIIGSYYGAELAVSDGTPEGTRLLADLEPGIKGCRAFQFFQTETSHFILAQKDDHSIALYTLGEQMPPIPAEPEPNPRLEVLIGNRSGMLFSNHGGNYDQKPPLLLNDGVITYLGHNTEVSNFDLYTTEGPMLSNALIQLDAATGKVINTKLFGPDRISQHNDWFLLPAKNGGYQLIRSGKANYQDESEDIKSHTNNSIHLTRFDAQLEFLGIEHLETGVPSIQRLVFVEATDDGFVVLAQRNWNRSHPLRLLKYDHDAKQVKAVNIPRLDVSRERMEAWHDERGQLNIALFVGQNDCVDCPLIIQTFDEDLSPAGLWTATYSGKLEHPRLHLLPNGERWFIAALNGEILLPGSSNPLVVSGDDSDSYGVVCLRDIAFLNRHLETKILDAQARKYYPSFSHEGNVYLNYLRTELGSDEFVPVSGVWNNFNVPHPFFYEIAQLDGLAEISAYAELEVELSDLTKALHFSQVIDTSGTWIRSVKAGRWNVAHVHLHKHPRPAYHDNFANRIQIFTDEWPFTPQPVPVVEAVPNEDGSYMHLFPNPSTGEFFIVPRQGGNRVPYDRFIVHDMQGRLIEERIIPSDFLFERIQFSNSLNAGVYHVVFSGGQEKESHRIVVIK